MPRGSQPGERRGGRVKGKPNKATAAQREAAAASGMTPLEYMLGVMRDRMADPERRDRMAANAAPYLHPKLANTTHSGDADNPVKVEHTYQWLPPSD